MLKKKVAEDVGSDRLGDQLVCMEKRWTLRTIEDVDGGVSDGKEA